MTERFMKIQNIREISQIHGARLKYLRNGFPMLEVAKEFDKRPKYAGNDVCMSKLA